MQGTAVLARLSKVIGAGAKTPDNPVVGILESLNEADLKYLCETFAKLTTFSLGDGKEPVLFPVFDEHFSATYDRLVKWLMFCLEVNFNSLFLALGVDLTQLSQLAAKPSGP